MDAFILSMYVLGRIDATKVQSYVPKFITQEQADVIIATPRINE